MPDTWLPGEFVYPSKDILGYHNIKRNSLMPKQCHHIVPAVQLNLQTPKHIETYIWTILYGHGLSFKVLKIK